MGCSSLNVVDNEGGEKNHRQTGSLPYFRLKRRECPLDFVDLFWVLLDFVGFGWFRVVLGWANDCARAVVNSEIRAGRPES